MLPFIFELESMEAAKFLHLSAREAVISLSRATKCSSFLRQRWRFGGADVDLVAATPCYPGCIFTDLSGDGMNGGGGKEIRVEGRRWDWEAGVARWDSGRVRRWRFCR